MKRKGSSNGADLKIEDGIPLPAGRGSGKYGHISDTLRKLQVGQSVLLPMFTKCEQLGSIRQLVQAHINGKLTTRVVKGGVRVWRIS